MLLSVTNARYFHRTSEYLTFIVEGENNTMATVEKLSMAIVGAAFLALGLGGVAQAFTLSNAPGDGSVTVGVDGYGFFGSAGGTGTSNAIYDPVGSVGPAGTAFQSGVLIGLGSGRTFLGGTNFSAAPIAGTSNAATSAFTSGDLGFQLTQTLTPTFDGSSRSGSQLMQAYTITNTSSVSQSFDLVRYFDGDLGFDGSLIDGGGRLINDGTEILFETDSATGSSTSTTFVGITSEGGTIPTTNRFEIDSFAGLLNRTGRGTPLDDTITNDGLDSDQFIDAGRGYDVTLALRNTFSLDAGLSANYTTSTIFGSGAPQDVTPPDTVPSPEPVPEPSTILCSGLALGFWSLMKRKQSRNLKKVGLTH